MKETMEYTTRQIENARRNYNNFNQYRTVESFEPQYIGWAAAEQRSEYHNGIVKAIAEGDKTTANQWKKFFLMEEVKADRKEAESKAKKAANKEASADILAPIKEARRIGEFGKWLNTSGNPFRKQHFNKKYTQEAVNAFLSA